jgi:hypothetical protein
MGDDLRLSVDKGFIIHYSRSTQEEGDRVLNYDGLIFVEVEPGEVLRDPDTAETAIIMEEGAAFVYGSFCYVTPTLYQQLQQHGENHVRAHRL